jgi:hypothetical protein
MEKLNTICFIIINQLVMINSQSYCWTFTISPKPLPMQKVFSRLGRIVTNTTIIVRFKTNQLSPNVQI